MGDRAVEAARDAFSRSRWRMEQAQEDDIVEEALRTGAGPARVVVEYGTGYVELSIEGAGAEPAAGLRERVRLFGGELVPGRRGGALRARLPLFGAPE